MFLTTHYLEEAENADQMYILESGKVLAYGSAKEIKNQYAPARFVVKAKEGSRLYQGWSPQQVIDYLRTHELQEFEYLKGSINDAFINITGKEIKYC